jgi:hypothetical protein
LLLPADLDADVDFESLSGDFRADFDVDLERREKRWARYCLGGHVQQVGTFAYFCEPHVSFGMSGNVTVQ